MLDAVINNADRKGGHLLPAADGRLYGIDHGVTFNAEDKLRTLLWGWAGEPLTAEAVTVLTGLGTALDGALADAADRADHHGRDRRASRARVAGCWRPACTRSPAGDGRRYHGRRSEPGWTGGRPRAGRSAQDACPGNRLLRFVCRKSVRLRS